MTLRRSALTVLVSGPLALLLAPLVRAQLPGEIPIDVRIPASPIPFVADGRVHLVYELMLLNVGPTARYLDRLAVRGDGRELAEWTGASLAALIQVTGTKQAEVRLIESGRQVTIYLWLEVGPGEVPNRLEHTLVIGDSALGAGRDTLGGITVQVSARKPPTLRPPLAGGPWLVGLGPSNRSRHRRLVLAQGGRARLPTRFAADWLKFGSDGRLVKGDSTRNENWYGYREPLLAVAAGTVVEAEDGIPENKARSDPVVPITIANVTGNHVVLDLGDGWHALYAHPSTGSVKVKRGDRVQAGQEIGRLGDSGGSDTPHLHFELSDGLPSAGAEGAPFVLESFEHLDTLTDLALIFRAPWTPKPGAARTRRGELPLDNWVVRFP